MKKPNKVKIAFEKLSPARQRIAVAKDVIAQILAKVYKPNRGFYIGSGLLPSGISDEEDVQANFDKIKNCNVCALGGCFLSIVKFEDDIKFEEAAVPESSAKAKKLIRKVFEPNQLALIETAFEKNYSPYHWSGNGNGEESNKYKLEGELTEDEIKSAIKFGRKYRSDRSRMIGIMQNIVDHKGIFVL